jgi:hypothetical protein
MAYKREGYKAHDNMKVLPKDLSGRSSANQRTPQIKPGRSPGKLRMANPNTGIDEAWNANSDVSQGMGNLASNATQNIYQNQNNTGFTNNPMLNSGAGSVNQGGGYGDFYGGSKKASRKEGVFNSKAALEAAGGKRVVSAGMTRDMSERAAQGTGSIQDMINSTISSVQQNQDTKREAGLNKYKSDAADAAGKLQADNDAKLNEYKASSQSKYNKLKGSYDKMTAAQKVQAAAAKVRRSSKSPKSVIGKVAKGVGGVVKGATKGVGGVVKGISKVVSGLFGRRRRKKSAPKKTTAKNTTTSIPTITNSKTTAKNTTAPKKSKRRRRWFSDIRLKHNISKVGSSLSGIPVYNFSYIGDSTIYQGAMAQDLMSMGYSNAVTIDNKSGYYMVDYDQIDVDMITI